MKHSIISLNLCLGLPNKIDQARKMIYDLSPTIIFFQEAEIETNLDPSLISMKDYNFYKSSSTPKSRLAAYVKTTANVKITVSQDSEVILIEDDTSQIFGVYRPFKVDNKKNYLLRMINFIESKSNPRKELVIIGDLNFDYSQIANPKYQNRSLYDTWLELVNNLGLTQFVKETTWMRKCKDNVRVSILDHIYSNKDQITNVTDWMIGDHLAVSIIPENIDKLKEVRKKTTSRIKIRSWKAYSQARLLENLSEREWDHYKFLGVEQHTFELNQSIMTSLNNTAREITVRKDESDFSWSPELIKLRRQKENLLRKARKKQSAGMLKRCRDLDKEFKRKLVDEEREKIRRSINLGDTSSLWRAINKAKNPNLENNLPEIIFSDTIQKSATSLNSKADLFRDYFETKSKVTGKVDWSPENSNTTQFLGRKTIDDNNKTVFTRDRLEEAIKITKKKLSSGPDLIPTRALVDSWPITAPVVLDLFEKIENTKQIPEIWKMSRIVPLHKKGDKTKVENYRPINNLCSLAKLFERCILIYIKDLQTERGIDITGTNQYGFKENSSTTKLCLHLQHLIAKGLESKEIISVTSLDLTAAFDVVDHRLLFKRMESIGLGSNVVNLVRAWLEGRRARVEITDVSSFSFEVNKGTIQGSVLGPFLFGLFVAPILEEMNDDVLAFADDTYLITKGSSIDEVTQLTEKKLNKLYQWLKNSGLVINESKTEFIVFGHNSNNEIVIKLNNKEVVCKRSAKILGIYFDSELNWSVQIEYIIKKAKGDSHMIKRLSKFFSPGEMLKILTALVFSKLYYSSVVWNIPSLKSNLKRKLLSISGYLIRVSLSLYDFRLISNLDIHLMANRATPSAISNYYHATMLYEIINTKNPKPIYDNLMSNAIHETRNNTTYFVSHSKNKYGLNCFSNRVKEISKSIPIPFYNIPKIAFKKHMKKEYCT